MAIDVASWLQQLSLAQYEPAFRNNDVDGDVLPDLTAEDLIAIGVTSVGHRRKLLSAIAVLGDAAPTPALTAAPASVPSARRNVWPKFSASALSFFSHSSFGSRASRRNSFPSCSSLRFEATSNGGLAHPR
jgi:hypothetical protein